MFGGDVVHSKKYFAICKNIKISSEKQKRNINHSSFQKRKIKRNYIFHSNADKYLTVGFEKMYYPFGEIKKKY